LPQEDGLLRLAGDDPRTERIPEIGSCASDVIAVLASLDALGDLLQTVEHFLPALF
jgi:hypothetical protein